MSLSSRYQDYVILDGKYIGQFEALYQNTAEIPWHQDKTAYAIFSDITVAILKKLPVSSLLDFGCGLGYFTARLKSELPELVRVVGVDVSPTAISKAALMFPEIEFRFDNIPISGGEDFDVVVIKDVLWYLLDDLAGNLATLASRGKRYVYIGQSFPSQKPFYGQEILPDAQSLFSFLRFNMV